MPDTSRSYEEEQFIIWNSTLGLRDFVTIGRIDDGGAWLEEPYDMVGPFSIETLETEGLISFAKCVVMSRLKWQEDQVRLRRESMARQQEAQKRIFEELNRSNRRKQRSNGTLVVSEKVHREVLELPAEGELDATCIKAAYRRLAKQAHPDVGGSHEHFVRITEARDILLECCD